MKNDTRIIFMGTNDFSAAILQSLIDNDYNVVAVISQPDKEVGRKRILQPTETKVLATKYNIPVFQPIKIRKDYAFVKELNPSLIITCAYGQIVPQGLLDIPPLGCINVHASLLPLLRGGAPIHHALIDGYDKTGVTIMQMIDKMDAGVMYAKKEITISDDDDLGTLWERLKVIGSELLISVLDEYIAGNLKGEEQDESKVTYAFNIKREEEKIDFNQDARNVFNQIRGLSPFIGAYTTLDGVSVKIYKSEVVPYNGNEENGTIVKIDKGIVVKCLNNAIKIKELQFSGKKKMDVNSYLNGVKKDQLLNKVFK
ncbi:MAG: methionyl-tRNA formyltransferase [Bacilli bacterium]|nr:methionyl-tRNA formyltransferase [Bacilli bacterium]